MRSSQLDDCDVYSYQFIYVTLSCAISSSQMNAFVAAEIHATMRVE